MADPARRPAVRSTARWPTAGAAPAPRGGPGLAASGRPSWTGRSAAGTRPLPRRYRPAGSGRLSSRLPCRAWPAPAGSARGYRAAPGRPRLRPARLRLSGLHPRARPGCFPRQAPGGPGSWQSSRAIRTTAPAGTSQVLTGGTRTGRVRSPGRDSAVPAPASRPGGRRDGALTGGSTDAGRPLPGAGQRRSRRRRCWHARIWFSLPAASHRRYPSRATETCSVRPACRKRLRAPSSRDPA